MVFSVSKRSFLHRFQQNSCPQERYVACRMRLDTGFDIVAFCDPLASEVMEQSSPYRAWPGSKIKRQKKKSLRHLEKKSPRVFDWTAILQSTVTKMTSPPFRRKFFEQILLTYSLAKHRKNRCNAGCYGYLQMQSEDLPVSP